MTRIRKLAVPPRLSSFPADIVTEAIAEDAKTKQILHDARNRSSTVTLTNKSVHEGAAIMTEFRRGSAAALARRIERKELITREQLVERLGGNCRWVTSALKGERLFSIQAPSGVDYFPAFYADPSIHRRALGDVAKMLSGLPAASMYHFFVSKSFTLGMTPLEALAVGRVKDVLATAAGFAVR
jgi:hypothetical protein